MELKIKVDTSELEKALALVKELNEQMEKFEGTFMKIGDISLIINQAKEVISHGACV
jgi:hypothetical protein